MGYRWVQNSPTQFLCYDTVDLRALKSW